VTDTFLSVAVMGGVRYTWWVFKQRFRMFLMRVVLVGVLSLLPSCAHMFSANHDKEKAKIHLQVAADQLNLRDYTKAIESTLMALKLDPDFAAAYNHLALIYMETKQFGKSEESFKKALELQPDYPEVFNNFGVLLNREDKYKEAISYFEKALAYDRYKTPENALTNMGYSYYKLGDTARAKLFHQKALDVMPSFCLASKNMGDVYAKEKNYGKASEYFQKAVTNCPLYQESEYKLGLVLMKLGQRQVARTQLEKLVQKHRSGPYVERSNEVLKYLQ
jgi:type IV pilus assembly protein PilF